MLERDCGFESHPEHQVLHRGGMIKVVKEYDGVSLNLDPDDMHFWVVFTTTGWRWPSDVEHTFFNRDNTVLFRTHSYGISLF